jgi:hypothetical protein
MTILSRLWVLWSVWLLLLLDAVPSFVQAFTSSARRRATKRHNHASPLVCNSEHINAVSCSYFNLWSSLRQVKAPVSAEVDQDTPLYDPPLVVSSQDSPPVPRFTSWDNLLATKHTTRSNKPLHSIPRFVDFCQSHMYHAERWKRSKSSGESGCTHIPNLLQGGAETGPIARTVAGQVVRVLGFYPELTSRPRHDLQQAHGGGDCDEQQQPQQQPQQQGFRHDHLEWVHQLQAQLSIIQQELRRVLATPELLESSSSDNDDGSCWTSLRTRRGQEWSDRTGWSHIALVDNFQLRPDNIRMFPQTAQLLQRLVGTERRIGPRLVAIAKQEAHSGIPEHCDFMNWMLTLHTALDGPQEGCGIIVNGVARDWTVGDPVVMDTTFLHETYNTSDQDLYLLLVDFWHPDLSIDEIDALRTFFAANSGL